MTRIERLDSEIEELKTIMSTQPSAPGAKTINKKNSKMPYAGANIKSERYSDAHEDCGWGSGGHSGLP